MKKSLSQILKAALPVSRGRKRFLFGEMGKLVQLYQPAIEQRAEVSLGNVEIRDMQDLQEDDRAYRWSRGVVEGRASRLAVEAGMDTTTLEILAMAKFKRGELVRRLKNFFYRVTTPDLMVYSYGGIYVNLAQKGAFNHPETWHPAVVHELSHRLWEVISGRWHNESDREHEWNEGFATFCQTQEFASLYPAGTDANGTLRKLGIGNVYYNWLNNVLDAVRVGGYNLFEIPKRWKEATGRDYSEIETEVILAEAGFYDNKPL